MHVGNSSARREGGDSACLLTIRVVERLADDDHVDRDAIASDLCDGYAGKVSAAP